jgi:hypothetical protein
MENASTPSFVKRVAEGGKIPSREIIPYNTALKPASRKLRNNMTAAEAQLWQYLRKDQLGVRFKIKGVRPLFCFFETPFLRMHQ